MESKGSILIIWIPVVFKGIALECFNSFSYTSNVSVSVNTEVDTNAIIYIYDTNTGVVEKGAEVAGEFYFDMIRVIEND